MIENGSSGTVIIGAGQAAFSLCSKMRALGDFSPITIIGDELQLPYQRPPLSKGFMLEETTIEQLAFRAADYYAENDIRLVLGAKVVAMDRVAKMVTLANGQVFAYERLVFATGTRPRCLPQALVGDLKGIYYIRSIADVAAMRPEFMAGRHVLIIGGGYIGLEAASVAKKLGLQVTLVEASTRILQRVAAPDTSAFFRDLHTANGVKLIENMGIEMLMGDENGHVTQARLADGSMLEFDFVVAGIGVLPNVELAADAGITCDNGIVVDQHCRSSDPDVLAIGDCASFPFQNGVLRLESVGHAIDHAVSAAHNLTGQTHIYDPKPWFWSDQYDCKMQIAGLSTGYDRIVTRRTDERQISFWYFQGEQFLAVDALNDPRAFMVGKRLLHAGQAVDSALIADLSVDLKTLL